MNTLAVMQEGNSAYSKVTGQAERGQRSYRKLAMARTFADSVEVKNPEIDLSDEVQFYQSMKAVKAKAVIQTSSEPFMPNRTLHQLSKDLQELQYIMRGSGTVFASRNAASQAAALDFRETTMTPVIALFDKLLAGLEKAFIPIIVVLVAFFGFRAGIEAWSDPTLGITVTILLGVVLVPPALYLIISRFRKSNSP